MTEAALGTTATVTSLSGRSRWRCRPGRSPGRYASSAARACRALRGSGRGSLFVRLDVAVPTALDEEQRALVEQLDEKLDDEAYRPRRGRRLLRPSEERAPLSGLRPRRLRRSHGRGRDCARMARRACTRRFRGEGRRRRRLELAVYSRTTALRRSSTPSRKRLAEPVRDGWEDRWRAVPPARTGRWALDRPAVDGSARDEPAVVVDPGRAFGTGAHPTTRACIELLARLERGSLLDAGCGSACLAVAAARLGFAPVVAVDLDAVAVEVAPRPRAERRRRSRSRGPTSCVTRCPRATSRSPTSSSPSSSSCSARLGAGSS